MTSSVFTYTPSYSASESSKPTTRVVRFNDGYEQRLSFGLQTDLKTWRLQFSYRTDAETGNIRAFFEARMGYQPFSWTNPYGEVAYYVCEEWNVEHAGCNLNNIEATFREVVSL